MKYSLSLLLVLITFCTKTYSQNNFQDGYFINNTGERINCLIKNEGWKNNPTQFKFKTSLNSEIKIEKINAVEEFGIIGKFKYIKRKVEVDISATQLNNLNNNSQPIWEDRLVFLQVLLEGKSSLYYYEESGLKRYFYNIENGKIIQLVYKKYKVSEFAVTENNRYQQQLYNSFLDCKNFSIQDFENLNYTNRSLTKITEKYNSCLGVETVNNGGIKKRVDFNLRLKVGISSTSLTVSNLAILNRYADFGKINGLRFEIEGEFIFPFNNNKWGGFIGLGKNSNIEEQFQNSLLSSTAITSLEYNAFEVLTGARHYMFVNANSKIALQFAYIWDVPSKLKLDYYSNDYVALENDIMSGSFMVGAGFHYKDFSLEANFNFNKSVFETNSQSYFSDHKSLNLLLSYSLL